MKPPKFRAWDKSRKIYGEVTMLEVWQDAYYKERNYGHAGRVSLWNPANEKDCGSWGRWIEFVDLEQFTGLLTADDRKEVYEGDIVQVHQFDNFGGDVTPSLEGSIEYSDEGACFCILVTKATRNSEFEPGSLCPISFLYGLHEESWTVIGNIHEGVKP